MPKQGTNYTSQLKMRNHTVLKPLLALAGLWLINCWSPNEWLPTLHDCDGKRPTCSIWCNAGAVITKLYFKEMRQNKTTWHICLYKNNRKKLITSTKIGFARWGFGQMYWRRKCNVEGRRGVQCAWWAWLGRRQREKWAWGEFAWRRLLRATPRRLLQRGRVFHLMNTMLMMMRHSWCH